MFLKRIEMQGFKSFADRVTINFDNSVTGVVGPNGCGKSNIADAIRWVLGEQSVKSLRGEKMTDIIFSGSENRKAQNFAEVTLVFDNTNHYLNSDLEEIEVTRKIYNTDQDAEYLINRNKVRLKDVVDLILDSGLGKDSLSMISQGNISAFAEAKPIERRAIFEEAAGVAKYKKRKIESINALNRTKDNLERTLDILNELEKQVSPLKRQARKAELYREKKAKLQEIEIAVLVDEISVLSSQKEEFKKLLFDLETSITMHKTQIQVYDNNNLEVKAEVKALENELNALSDKLIRLVNNIQILEKSKVELDQKRKYAIEQGNSEERRIQMQALLNEAKLDYEDRAKRFEKLNAELTLLQNELEEAAINLADASYTKEQKAHLVTRLEGRKEYLNNLLKDPFSSQAQSGVKTVMENRDNFYGIMGVVGQEITALKGYEEAIATALAGSVYHIITKDEQSARNAIEFLKRNKSGRATFLPCNVMKGHYLTEEAEVVCNNFKGYVGVAAEFVACEAEYDVIVDSLLANIIVTEDLKQANDLARLLKYKYKIVTIDGDLVNKGGSMTGGRVKNETSIISAKPEFERISQELESHQAALELADKAYSDLTFKKSTIESTINEKRLSIANLEPILDIKKAKYDKLQAEYNELNIKADESDEGLDSDSIVVQLNEAYSKKDELSTAIKVKRENRNKMNADIERKEQQIKQVRKLLDTDQENEKRTIAQNTAIETKLDNDLNRLASEYQMTYEYAKENISTELFENAKDEVKRLRSEIEALGNINMDAPEEYNDVNTRYETMKKEYDELIASRNRILEAIEKMDKIMIEQFKNMFDMINAELNNTFTALFGGGKAKLVLEDPSDILNTGIDIDVQPPGKSVTSIRLFSGGEKTLIAICVLFTILKVRPVPLIVFDEVEAALDQANVERFAKYVKTFEKDSQFIIITHRPGTMAQCDVLYGVTMQHRGVSQMLKVKLVDAIEMADKSEVNN